MIFAKGGYGLSWYRLENVSTDGIPLPNPTSPWVNAPNWQRPLTFLPNTLHFGGGIEWVPLRNLEGPSPFGTDIGIQGEALIYSHYLGVDINTVVRTSSGFEIGRALADSPFLTRYVFGLALTVRILMASRTSCMSVLTQRYKHGISFTGLRMVWYSDQAFKCLQLEAQALWH